MKKMLLLIFVGWLCAGNIHAAEESELHKSLYGVKLGGLYYLSYQAGQKSNKTDNYNKWVIKRAYFTLQKEINNFISGRITFDAHQDDSGDMKVRLKYLYAGVKFPDFAFITKLHLEFGLVHIPWHDFEEHINYYRLQDTMFIERVGILNSADFGLTVMGYFAGEVDREYQEKVNNKYPGRYGSFAFGVYNGGGYHAKEENQNKVFEERVTIRPLPDVIPGLQITELFITGKGNGSGTPGPINDWQTLTGMLSYEHQYFTLTGQYIQGKGNQKGDWADSLDYSGYSGFAEVKPTKRWRTIGRYDFFDRNVDVDDDAENRFIAGLGYDFGHHNIILVDWEMVTYEASGTEDDVRFQVTWQVEF